MRNINFTSWSNDDMNKFVNEQLDKNNKFLFNELDKLRERINNLEELIRIYEGRIQVNNGKEKSKK